MSTDRDPLINVEPVKQVTVQRHLSDEERASGIEPHLIDHGEVPKRPPHICPNCDYDLRGLTSRRCPECGEEFTLLEARMRAIELSDGVRGALREETLDQIKVYGGLGLMVLSIWLQNMMPGSLAGWFGVHATRQGWLMLIFMLPLWLATPIYKFLWDRTWPDAIGAAGVVAAAAGLILRSL